jgi:hypothetical protein
MNSLSHMILAKDFFFLSLNFSGESLNTLYKVCFYFKPSSRVLPVDRLAEKQNCKQVQERMCYNDRRVSLRILLCSDYGL